MILGAKRSKPKCAAHHDFSRSLRSLKRNPPAMTDQLRSKTIEENPIGKGLNAFRASFNTVCADRAIPRTLDALSKLDQEGMTIQLRCNTLL
jgi:hypothetical protein